MTVPVVTATQAAALDSASIASGTSARALMQRAGAAAAGEIVRRFAELLSTGVAIFTGPGNNGGDGWVVAGALAAEGVAVRVHEALPPSSEDARAERERTVAAVEPQAPRGDERIVVDALLGTGATGAPRGAVADAVRKITDLRVAGASVVALDMPSGLDATTGVSDGGVRAHLTLSFGSVKRGQLLNRDVCGTVVALDIGIGDAVARETQLPRLIDHSWVFARIPPIPFDAHKGTRCRLVITGGALGMAGAVTLAASGAFRSGIGMVRLVVAPENFMIAQTAVPQAIAASWPGSAERARELLEGWAHSLVIGPGLGNSDPSRRAFELITDAFQGPTLIDADGLNILASDPERLARLTSTQPVLITPHSGEMARLDGSAPEGVKVERFELAPRFAVRSGAVVLLKGVPTVIAAPDGRVTVSAAGTPVLATGGSGDILAGIAGTLLAQMTDPFEAASCAAWLHGRAGEIAAARYSTRGATLQHVLDCLTHVWTDAPNRLQYPVLAELPAVH
jgi:NAD(P)H-hydrate epimerase